MTKGWNNESARHSLSRKGISTGRKKRGVFGRIQHALDANQHVMMEDKLDLLKDEKEELLEQLKSRITLEDKEEVRSLLEMKTEEIEELKGKMKRFATKYDIKVKEPIEVAVEEEVPSPLAVFARG